MKDDGTVPVMQATCDDVYGVWLIEFEPSGKCFTPSKIEYPEEIVFSESTTNDFRSMVNYIEKYSTLENNSLAVHGEILVAIVWDLVSKVKVNDSAWAICTEYRKDVRVLFERDSEDEAVKSGEVSEYSVKLNESKAISFIEYGKCVNAAEKGSSDKWIEIESKLVTDFGTRRGITIFGEISRQQ